jgi:hypothetical protein
MQEFRTDKIYERQEFRTGRVRTYSNHLAKYYIRSFSLELWAATKTDTKTFKKLGRQKRGPVSGPLSSFSET